jgi:plastocyanin
VYGATTATLTCTYTKTSDGSTFTSEDNIPIEYSNPATVNYITDITTLGRLYKVNGGTLVAEVHATDGGDVKSTAASYYDLKRYDGTAVSTTYSDYGATDLYQFSTAATMRPFKMNFVDQIVKNRGTSATITSAEAGSHYYLIVPHYSMVNLPILSSELSNFLNVADANGDRTLTLTASAAPALDLENAKVKAVSTPAIKGDALLGTYTTDVISYDLGATIIDQTNEKVVTFVSGTDVPTGVEGVTVANASIVGGEGMITISGATNSVIYDITGRMVASVNGDNTVYVPAGVYIVKAGTTTKKVAVK